MKWKEVKTLDLDSLSGNYVVKTNGGEWRDVDIFVWPAILLRKKIKLDLERGKPIYAFQLDLIPGVDHEI